VSDTDADTIRRLCVKIQVSGDITLCRLGVFQFFLAIVVVWQLDCLPMKLLHF